MLNKACACADKTASGSLIGLGLRGTNAFLGFFRFVMLCDRNLQISTTAH
jgi:hypothetical protein